MSYQLRLDGLLFPVAPSKFEQKIKNQNKTVQLINGIEMNLMKSAGLMEIDFEVLLPNVRYPFAEYDRGFLAARVFAEKLKSLKASKSPFKVTLERTFPDGKEIENLSYQVTLESYSIREDAKQGFDWSAQISLKEYVPLPKCVNHITLVDDVLAMYSEQTREDSTSPAPTTIAKSHTVARGDSLSAIAKKYYGNASRYPDIYEANKQTIDDRNKGTGNSKHTIYPDQVVVIPI